MTTMHLVTCVWEDVEPGIHVTLSFDVATSGAYSEREAIATATATEQYATMYEMHGPHSHTSVVER